MPKLQDGATALVMRSFQIIKLDAWGELANLSVRHRHREIEASLRFQIHTTFGPLLSTEPIFWTYSVRHAGHLDSGEPGRLRDLQAPELVEAIVNQFVQRCVSAAE